MKIGVCYYPEQWPEDRWPVDARMMQQMQVDVVRVGEFAWSRLEPKRDRFELDWLADPLRILAEHGLAVILATPTAAPPVWLFQRHAGMVPVGPDGHRWHYGSRRDACVNNSAYRKYARRIVTELAKRFAADRNIYAWQVDNELGCSAVPVCYCDDCEQAFRQWLKRHYGTIDRLNSKWGTAFWGQTFNDFHDVPAPRRTPGGPHPSLALDYRRFSSAAYRAFAAEQAEIIRQQAGPSALITTNQPGGLEASQISQFALAGDQSVYGVDNYPSDRACLDATALALDLARSVKGRSFWVMEQQAGAIGVPGHSGQPRPGELRLWSYQAAARGAEMVCYFRWRTCSAGQQMHLQGMLDADGTPRRRFEELRDTIGELKERAQLWEGRLPDACMAIMLSYDAAWALEITPTGLELDYYRHVRAIYEVLRRAGVQVDFVEPDSDLAGYGAVVVPMPVVCTPSLAKQLEVYVFQGGRTLVTAPSGYRTFENTAGDRPPPGELTGLLGLEVTEHDILRQDSDNSVVLDGGRSFPSGRFCSVLELRGAEVLATYGDQYYAGTAAATVNSVGDGKAYFLGAPLSVDCCGALLGSIVEESGVSANPWASETVEVVPLKSGEEERKLTFVLNHSPAATTLPLAKGASCRDVLSERTFQGEIELKGYDVVLLEL